MAPGSWARPSGTLSASAEESASDKEARDPVQGSLASRACEMDGLWYEASGSARQVKFSAMYPTDERLPFDGCESEGWPLAVFGVADRDPTVLNERNLDARSIVAESGSAPQNVVEVWIPSAVGWIYH
jgi:hypothetical protein